MIEIRNLCKAYESVTPIRALNAEIHKGDVISIIGPSGTGKSTLLRMLNLLERPTSGQIFFHGEEITAPGYPLPRLRERVGMVFQNFHLFNHLTVIENVTFAPVHVRHVAPAEAYRHGMELLTRVGLAGFAFAYPDTLSGGQKQRVAIARALAMEPEVLLLDEPTSALDPTMVGEVQAVIRRLANQGYTMLLVTHDMAFAEKVANRVFFLSDGVLYEDGTPEQIFHHPQKEQTRAFILRLQELRITIDSPDYDYLSLHSAVTEFAFRSELPATLSERICAALEELCFGILLPAFPQDAEGSVGLALSYSTKTETAELSVSWPGLSPDLSSEEAAIPFRLFAHYATSYELPDGQSLRAVFAK